MRNRSVCLLTISALLLLLPQLTACQSSRSISKSLASLASVWSISKSFQASSGDEDISFNESYASDVAAVGASFVGSGESAAALRDDVDHMAGAHGVTDWEALDETWVGLGVGLRHAGLDDKESRDLLTRAFGEAGAVRALAAVRTE